MILMRALSKYYRFSHTLWMQSKSLVASICILLLASFLVTGCGGQDSKQNAAIHKVSTFQKIKSERVIRVGYVLAKPWVFKNPQTNELTGSFVDSMNEIARQMGVKVEFTEATFDTFAAGLQSGQFDLSISPTFSTIPRAMSVAFTAPLGALGNSAVVRKNETRFNSLKDIDQKGITVAVTQGEQGHEYAKNNFKNAKIEVIAGSDQNLAFSEVLSGRADVALGDAWFASNFAAQHANARDLFADNPYNVTPAAWAVRYEDQELLTFINTALDALETNGVLEAIDKKYDAKWLRPKKVWAKS
jgi:polar amino acid transport system substrate-binding protein